MIKINSHVDTTNCIYLPTYEYTLGAFFIFVIILIPVKHL